MKRAACVLGLGVLVAAAPAWAQKDDEEVVEEDAEEGDDEEEEEEEEEEATPAAKPKPKPAAKPGKPQEFKKQDLRGHAVDAEKIANPFQKDRFFVDKVDTEKTEDKTLIQGSLQWSNFAYRESGGALNGDGTQGGVNSRFNRYFTDLRLQTDFRHIAGGRWEGRIDARTRLVNNPDDVVRADSSQDNARIQSGFNGTNEVELREAWLVRSGKRSDFFIGRQFVTDLGAIKIDGIRLDYAKSEKLTFLGFAGLYPLRGSRSVFTDYKQLQNGDGDPTLSKAGRFVGSGGFGAAYRTMNMHGALGAVVLAPLSSERPRVYATANGYYRTGAALDLYHFAILDLYGIAADPIALTNLSAGANYKPNQRLRLTASFNRVDTETLNVQAGAFLDNPVDGGGMKVQNETILQLRRVSTNSARTSISAGLGNRQRFEVTIASAFRYRPEVTITSADGTQAFPLDASKAVDIYGSITDRRSFLDLRIGLDGSRSFGVGKTAFRSDVLAVRVFAARELGKGRGEWEAEISYSTTKDRPSVTGCATPITSPLECYGVSSAKILSAGGNLYYRIRGDLFGLGSVFVSQMGLDRLVGTTTTTDPKVTSLTGFARVAYRF